MNSYLKNVAYTLFAVCFSTAKAATLSDIPAVTMLPNFTIVKTIQHEAHITTLVLDPADQTYVFVNTSDSTLDRIDLCSGSSLRIFRRPGLDTYLPLLSVSSTGKFVATNDPLNRVFVANGRTGGLVREIRFSSSYRLLPDAAVFSEDEEFILIFFDDSVHKIRISSGEEVATYGSTNRNLVNDVVTMGVRRNGEIAVISQQLGFFSWTDNIQDNPSLTNEDLLDREILPSPGNTPLFYDRFLIVASNHRTSFLNLVDVNTGLVAQTFVGHSNWINGFAMSADARIAVSTAYDRTIRLWETHSGNELKSFAATDQNGDVSSPEAVAITPDGNLFVVAVTNGVLRIFSTPEYMAQFCGN